jgi:hypothetical protein
LIDQDRLDQWVPQAPPDLLAQKVRLAIQAFREFQETLVRQALLVQQGLPDQQGL